MLAPGNSGTLLDIVSLSIAPMLVRFLDLIKVMGSLNLIASIEERGNRPKSSGVSVVGSRNERLEALVPIRCLHDRTHASSVGAVEDDSCR